MIDDGDILVYHTDDNYKDDIVSVESVKLADIFFAYISLNETNQWEKYILTNSVWREYKEVEALLDQAIEDRLTNEGELNDLVQISLDLELKLFNIAETWYKETKVKRKQLLQEKI